MREFSLEINNALNVYNDCRAVGLLSIANQTENSLRQQQTDPFGNKLKPKTTATW